jgi:signal transduction histidine kinase
MFSALNTLAAALPHGQSLPEDQWRSRHRGLLTLLWLHVPALIVTGLLYGFPLWHALADVTGPTAFAVLALSRCGSRRMQALAVVFGLLTCSAVLVHITGGLIEAHFHYFVMVAAVSLYEDWAPFLVAVLFVLLQHGVMAGFVAHDSVFNHPGSSWMWAGIHSGFIAALSVACLVNWRASERQRMAMQSLVDSLAEGVVRWDADGRPVAANASARRLLGFDPAALANPNGSDPRWTIVRADGSQLPEEERPAAVAVRTGRPCTGVLLGFRAPDGSVRWLSTSARPVAGGDGVVVSFTDVTEEREALAALERSNAELQQFAYVASHDLSEPLRMVSSYLQLLRRRYHGRLDADADEFIDYAVDGAGRMRALIDDLLAYSRVGRGAEPGAVDLGEVAADVLRTLAPAIIAAHAQIQVEPLPTVSADRTQVQQLLQNLVANALKFRGAERAWVAVCEETAGEQPGMVQIAVADAGIGIDGQHRERIFKMFQRLHDREAYEGTGIGLAICRKIAERHGGRIWVDAREGGGSVFRFTLPRAVAEEPQDAAPEPAGATV